MGNSLPTDEAEVVILEPMYRLPLLIMLIGVFIFVSPFQVWMAITISSFGLFLLIQSFTLRLKFTSEELIVMQLGKEIRCFPFKNWLAWRIFLPQLPGILYFRETASPHLLPILFDRSMLETQLKLRVGSKEITHK